MKDKTDIATGLVVMGLTAIGMHELSGIDNAATTDLLGPASFPRAVLVLLLLFAVALIWQGFHSKPHKAYWPTAAVLRRMGLFSLWFVLYVALVAGFGQFFADLEIDSLRNNMGFLSATFIYLTGALFIAGRRRPLEILLVATLVPVSIIISFGQFFQILLP